MMPDGNAFVLTSSNERAGVPSAKKRFPARSLLQGVGEVLQVQLIHSKGTRAASGTYLLCLSYLYVLLHSTECYLDPGE